MRIVNLVEDTEGSARCRAEHGLSFYIETEERRILMDAGASELLLENAEKRGVDLSRVEIVVLSHGHYDHGGGLTAFLQVNQRAQIYMQEAAFGPYYSHPPADQEPHFIGLPGELADSERVVLVKGACEIGDGMSLFPVDCCIAPVPRTNRILLKKTAEGFEPDDFCHEQCLMIREGERSVLFSGCAHHGILNVMHTCRERFGKEPDAVISGFHLMRKSGYTDQDVQEIREIARQLTGYRTKFYTGHCTGTEPCRWMKEILNDQLEYIHCGDEVLM